MEHSPIIVIGHKNPDTDSICSAICYANLKNQTEPDRYVPKRAGKINNETAFVLNYFHTDVPDLINDVNTQVADIEYRKTPGVKDNISVKAAWKMMRELDVVTLPVVAKDNVLGGLITINDIAKSYMDDYESDVISKARTPYSNLIEVLEGTLVSGNPHNHIVNGKVIIGAANPQLIEGMVSKDDLMIVGDRIDTQIFGIEMGVGCLILCLDAPVNPLVLQLAEERHCSVITTKLDTYTVARLINQSIPIRYFMKKDNLITFSTEDFTDDIQDVMIKHRHRAFPVINKRGKCVGTISRRNFLGMHKKQVVLVDHNEIDQAVDNIEKADILEIIDHHKLGTLQTVQPISFRNQPVGCTGTIMYQIYGEQKLEISPKIAGLLCAAIISDTLMFRSPTCTLQDKMAAGALALIADISIEQFAKEMFRAGSNLKDKSPEEIFYQDYKKFIAEGDICFGVGQISSMDSEELKEIKERLLPFMVSECGRHGVTRVYFMLTDIITQSTELLFYGEGSREMAENAFKMEPENDAFYLEGVVSRKKQLIPPLMEAAQMSGDYA